jgi:hypothetical protein
MRGQTCNPAAGGADRRFGWVSGAESGCAVRSAGDLPKTTRTAVMKYYSLESALESVVQQASSFARVYMIGRRIANGSVILAAKRPSPRGCGDSR